MIKVAYLLGSLNHGGTETLLLDVFNSSKTAPFSIIGIYRKEGLLSKSFHSSPVTIFKLTPGTVLLLWLYLWRLRKLLKVENVNVVHAQQCLDAVYARLSTIGLPIKVIQTFHAYDFSLSLLSRLLLQFSLKIVDLNIFVSYAQRQYYSSKYKLINNAANTLVYNGINFNKFNGLTLSSIRTELGINKNRYLLGMVGNFVPGHDQLTICRFLALLLKQGIAFSFLFIGKRDASNPQLFDDCLSFCEKNDLKNSVLFLGSRFDVPAILPQLDAFLYSSDHDTFGISVIEAIAAGIPVFVNDWDVMKEITEEGKRVILYRTKDEKDLLSKFLPWIAQPEIISKSAAENAEWARKTYSIQNHVGLLNEVYEGMTLSNY